MYRYIKPKTRTVALSKGRRKRCGCRWVAEVWTLRASKAVTIVYGDGLSVCDYTNMHGLTVTSFPPVCSDLFGLRTRNRRRKSPNGRLSGKTCIDHRRRRSHQNVTEGG